MKPEAFYRIPTPSSGPICFRTKAGAENYAERIGATCYFAPDGTLVHTQVSSTASFILDVLEKSARVAKGIESLLDPDKRVADGARWIFNRETLLRRRQGKSPDLAYRQARQEWLEKQFDRLHQPA